MTQSHSSRIALITGANRGIGKEIARQLARAGLKVVLTARDLAQAQAAALDLQSEGSVAPAMLDVSDEASIATAVAAVTRDVGPIDVLVNNAAIMIDGPGGFDASLLDLQSETLRRTWETNVMGPVLLMRTVLPGMVDRAYGRIVNMSSLGGQLQQMGSGFPAYRMSKVALNAATRIAAAEFNQPNIKINAASPGWVRTAMGGSEATRSVTEGADTPVWLAQLPDMGPTGGFFHDRKAIAW